MEQQNRAALWIVKPDRGWEKKKNTTEDQDQQSFQKNSSCATPIYFCVTSIADWWTHVFVWNAEAAWA